MADKPDLQEGEAQDRDSAGAVEAPETAAGQTAETTSEVPTDASTDSAETTAAPEPSAEAADSPEEGSGQEAAGGEVVEVAATSEEIESSTPDSTDAAAGSPEAAVAAVPEETEDSTAGAELDTAENQDTATSPEATVAASSTTPEAQSVDGSAAIGDSQGVETESDAGDTGAQESVEDFAKMVDESKVEDHSRDVNVGDKISGVVVKNGPENCFVDFGGRSEGVISSVDLKNDKGENIFAEGDPVEAFVTGVGEEITLARHLSRADEAADLLYQAYKAGMPVEGKVDAVNKWGLGVNIQGTRAFCPISQIETHFVEDTTAYRGQSMNFKIIEFRNQGRNVVVSRRALLEADQKKEADAVRSAIREGAEFDGKVTRLESFGAFVELGAGVEGMVHVSEIKHERVEHPNAVLSEGEEVKVRVIKVKSLGNQRKERISLSIKALEKDPWAEIRDQFKPGSIVPGKVESMEDFGAFVELVPNVKGLVHVSEVADRRIAHPREVLSVGDEVQVAVLEVDNRRKRFRLSIRQVESMESAQNLKDFQQRQKEEKESTSSDNAMMDALKRANLIE